MREKGLEDISQNPNEPLLDIGEEHLMPLPCLESADGNQPPIKPLSDEQRDKYECDLDGVTAVRIPKPATREVASTCITPN